MSIVPDTSAGTSTQRRERVLPRIAGAPISWGVSEVRGWGHQLPAHRVLAEMRDLGLTGTELGPAGFLPDPPAELRSLLSRHGLRPAGGFVPVVLHGPSADLARQLTGIAADFARWRTEVLVLAAQLGRDGYDTGADLDPAEWRILLANLDLASRIAADHGLTATLHPHVGTAVERPEQVRRVLDGSTIALCLDTGHYLVGGGDPAALASSAAGRIAHVHLKDADPVLSDRVRSGQIGLAGAVAAGLFRPLGQGAAGIDDVVGTLETAGYRGWYVLEQDVRLDDEPPRETGPITAVRASLDYVVGLLAPQRPPDNPRG